MREREIEKAGKRFERREKQNCVVFLSAIEWNPKQTGWGVAAPTELRWCCSLATKLEPQLSKMATGDRGGC